MCAIRIFTDSTNDLTPELIDTYNIGIIPLYVTFEENSYRDGVDITPTEVFAKVEKTGTLPKTAAPTPADFIKAFKPALDQGDDIIYIGLSSLISSTIANAKTAAEELDPQRIRIIDSLNLSSGIALLTLKACDLVKEGKSVDEICQEVTNAVPKVRTSFVIDTLDYLYKGGRCSPLQTIFGTLLSIKPIIKVVDGKMILGQKARKRQNALNALISDCLAEIDQIDTTRMFVGYSSEKEDALAIIEEIKEKIDIKEIHLIRAGCVISSHCGPNTVGIYYMLK